jgi:hypothetical protein
LNWLKKKELATKRKRPSAGDHSSGKKNDPTPTVLKNAVQSYENIIDSMSLSGTQVRRVQRYYCIVKAE